MKFERVKIIEDCSQKQKIPFNKNTLYAGPMQIGDIEDLEDTLLKAKVPYILAECETTIETLDNEGIRFAKGYCLFTKYTGVNNE